MNKKQIAKKPPRLAQSTRFLYIGGRLAVDFVNSEYSPLGPTAGLQDWEGLVEFLSGAGVVGPARAMDLLSWRHSAPQVLPGLLQRALRLRAAIRSSLEARVARAAVAEASVEVINDGLRVTEGHDELVWEQGDWRLKFHAREEALEWLLAAMARSAAEVIAEGPEAPVRKCANPNCGLFFYDHSRTRRRRWCVMSVCGNRSKVAAFARRNPRRRR
jgi:predicted RNA-binding Zn ribbon-like protein